MFWSRKTKGRVFVGLSGGVDSAVSAALLKQQGFDVTGVFIRIAIEGYPCSAGADRVEAMRVAAHLQIPFIEIDLSREYREAVFEVMLAEFSQGRTPNPDALCNREIKFGTFFAYARKNGADFVATGHYAQVREVAGEFHLQAGADESKDQSYFLWMVPQAHLRHTLFPVGHLQKKEVRNLAQKFKLPNRDRKDSQGLCFLGDIPMGDMLAQELTPVPGDVLAPDGTVIGKHEGSVLYTLGQRHGFILASAGAQSIPHYVVGKDLARNTITVATSPVPPQARATTITLTQENWIGTVPAGTYQARYRYRQPLIPARLNPTGGVVELQEPHFVPEGQSLVLYNGARCVGGGIIKTAEPRTL